MAYLNDTNCLLRFAFPQSPLHPLVDRALEILRLQGEELYVTPQNLIEFWNVTTRPIARNGFGFTPAQADQEIARIQRHFRLAQDTPDIFPVWHQLVATVGVSGVQVHDARLVAVMQVHGLTHLLTFNTQDFRRYPGITVVHPQDVVGTPPAGPAPP